MVEQDVEVSDRPEQAAEPAELRAQRLGPFGRDQAARGTEQRTRPACRDAQLVEGFRVLAEPDAWVVREHRLVLRDEERAKPLDGLAVRPRRSGRAGREDSLELRDAVAAPGTSLAKRLTEPPERCRIAGHDLGFDLRKGVRPTASVEDVDAVDHDFDPARALGDA